MFHLTINGYEVTEVRAGLCVRQNGEYVCLLADMCLDDFEDEDTGEINDISLEADIEDEEDLEVFLAYQRNHC